MEYYVGLAFCLGHLLVGARRDGRVVSHTQFRPLQPSRLTPFGTLPYTGGIQQGDSLSLLRRQLPQFITKKYCVFFWEPEEEVQMRN